MPDRPVRLLQPPIWERQRGESIQAWSAFVLYRDMGTHRSLLDAYRQSRSTGPNAVAANLIRTIAGTWRNWSSSWQWTLRSTAWDAHVDELAREAQEQAARDMGVRLAEERRAQRERELDIGNRLMQRAEEMLALPVIEVTTERDTPTGRVTQVIHPAKWRVADIARVVEAAVQLRRLGLDMPTSRQDVRIDIEDEVRRMARENGWDEEATVRLAQDYKRERGELG